MSLVYHLFGTRCRYTFCGTRYLAHCRTIPAAFYGR